MKFILFLLLCASVSAQPCPNRTGGGSTVIVGPGVVESGDVLTARTESGACVGQATAPSAGAFSLVAWRDDYGTVEADGLVVRDRVSLDISRNGDVVLETPSVFEHTTDAIWIADGVIGLTARADSLDFLLAEIMREIEAAEAREAILRAELAETKDQLSQANLSVAAAREAGYEEGFAAGQSAQEEESNEAAVGWLRSILDRIQGLFR